MKSILAAFLFLLGLSTFAKADTVVFKNGDKLTGTLVNVNGGNLTFKSEAAGDLSIPLAKVQSFSVDKPAVILGKDRKVVRGQIALENSGNWQVTANGTSQTVPAANVSAILPADTYHTLAEVPAKPWQDWKGSATFGYAMQSGDQDTHTLTGVIVGTRERPTQLLFMPHWRTNYGLTMLFSKAQQDGTTISADTITTNLREDYLFTARNFVFGVAQLDHIQPQGLYLRQTFGGGVGRDVIHTQRTIFSLIGGFNYVHEKFLVGPSDRTADALAGEKLGIQLTKRLRLDHFLNFYPDLPHASEYRADTSTGLTFKLNSRLTWNAGVIDLFLTNPGPGSHQNNTTVTTGVGYTF